MGELGALFNPGMRHEIEERESKANRREEEGNARDGDLRIDLASGVAVINIPTKSAGDSKTDSAAPDRQVAEPATGVPPTESARSASSTSKPASPSRGASALPPRAGRGATRSSGSSGASRAKKTVADDGTDKPVRAPVPSSKASRAAR